ncbi:hypothetical protein FA13DRAFT_1726015 [Coprinellus micaceus]|uniref:SHSP domain-containing protein n=1 Tax=Coprinellus micaceus TaxID=71717 RepID=A0A4Y7TVZ2_COPMI|nr:hypothetical protein FA13DRAFT_1726015 [Coprinellus micaceus]
MRQSSDGGTMVATFDLSREVAQDVHLQFMSKALTLTWATRDEHEEWAKDGVLYRERTTMQFHRTIPLPNGLQMGPS